MYLKNLCFFFEIILFSYFLSAQNKGIQNLPAFDLKPIHFGFTIGINQMNFSVKRNQEYKSTDTLLILHSKPKFGFHIGIISDLRLNNNFNLRFIPTLTFGDRILYYSLLENGKITDYNKKIESSLVDFPLLLKFKSNRMTNVRGYIFGGAKISVDAASLAKRKQQDDDIIKLKRIDYTGEIGSGFEFYLEYFKFGIELKMSYGIFDILKREGNIYTNSIERLNTKIFFLSLTFE